ncbi:DUF1697 domain-containing protein [Agromyces italicus]|uniref:DUF1697 domain-containing protein n=1 Tax=Agromyces italicus TaxID=279572 RepID=UPI0003B516B0|nr:DUF1697 domain-containing protein [Agromyces italicus]
MTEWTALLRGVNVGGVTIRSAELAALFRELDFDGVRTVLASGNVVFASDDGAAEAPVLKSRVERALSDRFGYEAWVVLVTRAELERAVEAFPFDAADESRQPWVIFGSSGEVLDELLASARELDLDDAVDPIARGEGVVYWNPVKGTTVDTPFAKLLAKAQYRPTTTNRNLRTLVKVLG